MNNIVFNQFYNFLWKNPACQEIFFKHKEELLKKDELEIGVNKSYYYIPRIVISNTLKRREGIDKRLESRIENQKIELSTDLESLITEKLRQPKAEEFLIKYFEKPFNVLGEKFEKGNVTRTRLVTEIVTSFLSEKRFIKFLKKYGFIKKEIESLDELIERVTEFLEKEAFQLTESNTIQNITVGVDGLSKFYSNRSFESLMDANSFHIDTLYDRENYKSRISLFDELYDMKVIKGGFYQTYYECTHCNVGVFSGNMTLNVMPSKVKLKCPNCNKEVFYLAPYKIDNAIYQHITHKDGLLFHALQFLLTEKGQDFYVNHSIPPNVELDILTRNKAGIESTIEVKVFKSDRPSDTKRSNLNQAISKIVKKQDALKEIGSYENILNGNFYLVTNIDDSELIKETEESYNDLNARRIKILSPKSFQDYLENGII